MQLSLLTGRSNPALAASLASELNVDLVQTTVEDFPDGELQVVVHQNIQGHDVFLIQSIAPPCPAKYLLELLLIADACKRAGAARITAVIPYLGYARQDRRTKLGQPVGARLLADLIGVRVQRMITLDLHNPAVEGFFTIPVEHLTAVDLLAEKLRASIPENSVLVAPDLGAVKLIQRYADLLNLPVAYIHKIRHSGKEVSVQSVTGEIIDRMPVLIDDMISTGGTMISAVEALLDMNCRTPVTIAATHGLLISKTARQLAFLPLAKIILTNSVSRDDDATLPLEYVSISPLLANKIKRLYRRS
jgi:ribose-phosphate pyrophosphokinase